MKTIVRMKFGAHLYGTETPMSDFDYKSVYLPDARSILLQRVDGSVQNKREKAEGEKNLPGEFEEESFALQRYLALLVEGQTVALDMLFAPPAMWEDVSDIWREIIANRSKLLTRKSAAFVGYCRQQSNKYGIKGSRVAEAKEARDLFERLIDERGPHARLSECESDIEEFVQVREHCGIVELEAAHSQGRKIRHFECCNRKTPWTVPLKVALDTYDRIYLAYGARARRAQSNDGVDWKALSHAVRVGREALELMKTGHITFPLPNRDHIKAIKLGDMPYSEVAAEIEGLLAEVEDAERHSVLPISADLGWVDDFVTRHYRAVVGATILESLG